jgi:hypothetical protein
VADKDQDASISPATPLSLQSMPSWDSISSTCCDSVLCETRCIYLLLAWLSDVLLAFEERANVHCLASPEISVDGPVEGEFEGAAVEGASAG